MIVFIQFLASRPHIPGEWSATRPICPFCCAAGRYEDTIRCTHVMASTKWRWLCADRVLCEALRPLVMLNIIDKKCRAR